MNSTPETPTGFARILLFSVIEVLVFGGVTGVVLLAFVATATVSSEMLYWWSLSVLSLGLSVGVERYFESFPFLPEWPIADTLVRKVTAVAGFNWALGVTILLVLIVRQVDSPIVLRLVIGIGAPIFLLKEMAFFVQIFEMEVTDEG